jgi:hypothetical protein
MGRSMWRGRMPFMLNIEELATLWHFPIEYVVKAPLIQKTPGRKAEPPTSLPIGDDISSSSELIDEIFVSDQPRSHAQPAYKPENIFDLGMEEDEASGSHYTGGTVAHNYNTENNDPFGEIFVEPTKPKPQEVQTEQSEGGTPPSNLPFV